MHYLALKENMPGHFVLAISMTISDYMCLKPLHSNNSFRGGQGLPCHITAKTKLRRIITIKLFFDSLPIDLRKGNNIEKPCQDILGENEFFHQHKTNH
jgi:hypothetical protein